jgi:hypothetical protein
MPTDSEILDRLRRFLDRPAVRDSILPHTWAIMMKLLRGEEEAVGEHALNDPMTYHRFDRGFACIGLGASAGEGVASPVIEKLRSDLGPTPEEAMARAGMNPRWQDNIRLGWPEK